jgi:hypothetical protein
LSEGTVPLAFGGPEASSERAEGRWGRRWAWRLVTKGVQNVGSELIDPRHAEVEAIGDLSDGIVLGASFEGDEELKVPLCFVDSGGNGAR